MGMKKISSTDAKHIVQILRRWPVGTSLSWEKLRSSLGLDTNEGAKYTWSRQSLSANEEISRAFSTAKKRLAQEKIRPNRLSDTDYEQKISDLEAELADVQARYNRLILQHARLAYNASQLEGGSKLLDDQLPDNTKSQRG